MASSHIRREYERFRHLDRVLTGLDDTDDPIYKTARALWQAIKADLAEEDAPKGGDTP